MKTSQKLKLVAQKSIIQYIKDYLLEDEYVKSGDKFVVNKSEFAKRRKIFSYLKKYGYPQFIISNDPEEFFPEPSIEVEKRDPSQEYWTAYIIFNVGEIQEYLNFIQSDQSPLEMIKENFEGGKSYGGPGRPFRNDNCIFQKRNRIIVECSGGRDW